MCLIESRCISMTLSVVVLSLKVCPDMSLCPRVPLKQTSLGSRRSSILSEVKGKRVSPWWHSLFNIIPFITYMYQADSVCLKSCSNWSRPNVASYCSRKLFFLLCCYLPIVWWKSIYPLEEKNNFWMIHIDLWYFWRLHRYQVKEEEEKGAWRKRNHKTLSWEASRF